jgi:hypothetical protein
MAMALGLALSAPAGAATITYYFAGTWNEVSAATGSAVGAGFSGSITYDSSAPALNTYTSANLDYADYQAVLSWTLDTGPFSTSGPYGAPLRILDGHPGLEGFLLNDETTAGGEIHFFQFVLGDDVTSSAITSVAIPEILDLGSFNIARVVYHEYYADRYYSGTISALSLTPVAAPVSPVPEPSAWALLIAGFGLAGAALRRQPMEWRSSRP